MREKIKKDEQGREIGITWVDDEGKITENNLGVASMKSVYLNDDGVSREEHNYDLAGKPVEDKLGIAFIRRIWDDESMIMKETYHDLQGAFVEIMYGFCEVHYHLDDNKDLHSAYCYDRKGQIVDEPKRYHI